MTEEPPGLHSWYRLREVTEKFDLSPYPKLSSVSKMAPYIGGRQLQLKKKTLIARKGFSKWEPLKGFQDACESDPDAN